MAGRRTFRILTSSQQSGIKIKKNSKMANYKWPHNFLAITIWILILQVTALHHKNKATFVLQLKKKILLPLVPCAIRWLQIIFLTFIPLSIMSAVCHKVFAKFLFLFESILTKRMKQYKILYVTEGMKMGPKITLKKLWHLRLAATSNDSTFAAAPTPRSPSSIFSMAEWVLRFSWGDVFSETSLRIITRIGANLKFRPEICQFPCISAILTHNHSANEPRILNTLTPQRYCGIIFSFNMQITNSKITCNTNCQIERL